MTTSDARAVLEARARHLARPADTTDDAGADAIDLLVVQVEDEQLAIPLASIVAIARPGSVARLPRVAPPVYGVTAWRGRPLTVLSLSSSPPVATIDSRLIVLGSGSRAALAVLVDAVHDVRRTARGDLAEAGAGPRRSYALGVTPDGLLVVSGDALLDPGTLSP
ncbi:MAG: chemotaxis protein CheW [Gemmatimonadaceae bacterium]|nr:chemotaxis protein CheW [Gemmatimonadaceae bacterium]